VERIALLQQQIEGILGTFYTQVMFAEYEMKAHEMVEAGQPITAETLSGLYTQLWKNQQGDAVTFDSLYGATWARIGHFYRTPYYVYKYATCYASSAQIARTITAKGDNVDTEAAIQRYLDLLRAGGSDYPMELLKRAGVDLSQPEPIQAAVDLLDNLVTRYEQELQKL
jgi:oligoendopeptidase F